MELLWAPWRRKYVEKPQGDNCFLCEALKKEDGLENFILHRGKHSFIIMNLFPYNSGHLMVAPLRHEGDFLKIKDEEFSEIVKFVKLGIKALNKVYSPQGFNVGINIGKPAGAGLIDHIHVHIVPRWEGDTNFLPVTSGTKVIPEDIKDSYRKIKKEIDSLVLNGDY